MQGNLSRTVLGGDYGAAGIAAGNNNIFAMSALNAGWCARFRATETEDIKSVSLRFTTANTPGTLQLRIETIDATTGKPTGTLYDANAVKSFTPSVGINIIAFDVLPTTGLVIGTEYAILLITTVAGTTVNLASACSSKGGTYPVVTLTTTTAGTRSSFAEVTNTSPTCIYTNENDEIVTNQFTPYAEGTATTTALNIFGTIGAGAKITIPSGLSVKPLWAEIYFMGRTGTPAGDLRFRIFDSTDAVILNSTVIIDKDSLLATSGRGLRISYPKTIPNLSSGVYRLIVDSPASVNNTNCWRIRAANPITVDCLPANIRYCSAPDVGIANPVWTDSDILPDLQLAVDEFIASGGSSVLILDDGDE